MTIGDSTNNNEPVATAKYCHGKRRLSDLRMTISQIRRTITAPKPPISR